MLSGPLSLLSWILIIFAKSLFTLFVARILQGIVVGIVFTIGPIYMVEFAEPEHRGKMTSMMQVFWNIGLVWIYATGSLLNYKLYLFACAILSAIVIPVFITMPKSPYFLIMVNKMDEAYESLSWFRDNKDVKTEFDSITRNVKEDMLMKGTFIDLFATKNDRKAFFIVQFVCFVRYLNGTTALLVYATQLFYSSDSRFSPYQLTLIMGIIILITSIIASLIADSAGRRTFFILSTGGTTFFNAIIATYLYFDLKTMFKVSKADWIPYLAIIGICIVNTIGIGSLLLTVQAEYFPSHTRAIGGGVTETVAAISAFVSIKAYAIISESIGVYWNYIIYTVISLIGFIGFFFILPETAGKRLGKIHEDFQRDEEHTLFENQLLLKSFR